MQDGLHLACGPEIIGGEMGRRDDIIPTETFSPFISAARPLMGHRKWRCLQQCSEIAFNTIQDQTEAREDDVLIINMEMVCLYAELLLVCSFSEGRHELKLCSDFSAGN